MILARSAVSEKIAAKFPILPKKILEIDGDYIALLDPYASSESKYWKHLVRLTSAADVVWGISAPNLPNTFSDIQLNIDNGNITAWTWDCYRLLIDKNNGEVISSVFTK